MRSRALQARFSAVAQVALWCNDIRLRQLPQISFWRKDAMLMRRVLEDLAGKHVWCSVISEGLQFVVCWGWETGNCPDPDGTAAIVIFPRKESVYNDYYQWNKAYHLRCLPANCFSSRSFRILCIQRCRHSMRVEKAESSRLWTPQLQLTPLLSWGQIPLKSPHNVVLVCLSVRKGLAFNYNS